MLAVRTPISAELRCRSQRAVGNKKDTHSISTASLAFAHPQMTNSSQWKSPNPADGHKYSMIHVRCVNISNFKYIKVKY